MEAGASDVQPAKDDDGNLEGYKVRDPEASVHGDWVLGVGRGAGRGCRPAVLWDWGERQRLQSRPWQEGLGRARGPERGPAGALSGA